MMSLKSQNAEVKESVWWVALASHRWASEFSPSILINTAGMVACTCNTTSSEVATGLSLDLLTQIANLKFSENTCVIKLVKKRWRKHQVLTSDFHSHRPKLVYFLPPHTQPRFSLDLWLVRAMTANPAPWGLLELGTGTENLS